jgi:hypothetical protein
MDDAPSMRIGERGGDLKAELTDRIERQAMLLGVRQAVGQRVTVQKLHRQERLAARQQTKVDDLDDAGMIQLGQDARLFLEATAVIGPSGEKRVQQLERHPIVDVVGAHRLVDLGHSPGAEPPTELVLVDLLAGAGGRLLGVGLIWSDSGSSLSGGSVLLIVAVYGQRHHDRGAVVKGCSGLCRPYCFIQRPMERRSHWVRLATRRIFQSQRIRADKSSSFDGFSSRERTPGGAGGAGAGTGAGGTDAGGTDAGAMDSAD